MLVEVGITVGIVMILVRILIVLESVDTAAKFAILAEEDRATKTVFGSAPTSAEESRPKREVRKKDRLTFDSQKQDSVDREALVKVAVAMQMMQNDRDLKSRDEWMRAAAEVHAISESMPQEAQTAVSDDAELVREPERPIPMFEEPVFDDHYELERRDETIRMD